MPENKKEFLVIGSNNFWYATHSNLKDAMDESREIGKGGGGYADAETGREPLVPDTVYIYKAELIIEKEIKN